MGKIYRRRHALTPNWIYTFVEIEDGKVVRQWSDVPGGKGGLINEPQELMGLELSDLVGFKYWSETDEKG